MVSTCCPPTRRESSWPGCRYTVQERLRRVTHLLAPAAVPFPRRAPVRALPPQYAASGTTGWGPCAAARQIFCNRPVVRSSRARGPRLRCRSCALGVRRDGRASRRLRRHRLLAGPQAAAVRLPRQSPWPVLGICMETLATSQMVPPVRNLLGDLPLAGSTLTHMTRHKLMTAFHRTGHASTSSKGLTSEHTTKRAPWSLVSAWAALQRREQEHDVVFKVSYGRQQITTGAEHGSKARYAPPLSGPAGSASLSARLTSSGSSSSVASPEAPAAGRSSSAAGSSCSSGSCLTLVRLFGSCSSAAGTPAGRSSACRNQLGSAMLQVQS